MSVTLATVGSLDAALARKFAHLYTRIQRVVVTFRDRVHQAAMRRAVLLPENPSGNLANHIFVGEEQYGFVGTIYTQDVSYAVYVEFGTGARGANDPPKGGGTKADLPDGWSYNPAWPGMAAIPFLYPSLLEIEVEYLGTMHQVCTGR